MKKILSALLIGLTIANFTGCTKKEKVTTDIVTKEERVEEVVNSFKETKDKFCAALNEKDKNFEVTYEVEHSSDVVLINEIKNLKPSSGFTNTDFALACAVSPELIEEVIDGNIEYYHDDMVDLLFAADLKDVTVITTSYFGEYKVCEVVDYEVTYRIDMR